MPDLYEAALEAMAEGEAGARDALAKAEKDFKDEVHRAVSGPGFDAVRTGNEDLDRALGDISEAGKQAGGELAEQRAQLGKTLTELRKNPGGTVAGLTNTLVNNLSNAASNPLGALSGVLGGGGGGGGGGSSGPSRADIERQVRQAKVEDGLSQLRERLNKVAVARSAGTGNRRAGTNRYSDESQLRVRFRNAASELQGTDGAALALLVSTSGFRTTINTRRSSQQSAASDARPASVRFAGFVSDDKRRPKATIAVPELEDASSFDARRIAHYEIQKLIELYLPDVEIEGPKTYVESQLAVRNDTDEPIAVWVQARWRHVENASFVWDWSPGNPPSREAHRFKVEPGKTKLLEISSRFPSSPTTVDSEPRPLTASRVRLWVESESGERWMKYSDRDLWLVPQDSQLDETRGYFADKIRTFTHVIEPQAGGRIYNERLVRLSNKTGEPISVDLAYRSSEGGQTAWRAVKSFKIPAGASGYPLTSEGMKVRASQIRFSAQSDNFFFGQNRRQPLFLVTEVDGRRLYFAEKIGLFEHVFEPPSASADSSDSK
jgi:hypothetical protein